MYNKAKSGDTNFVAKFYNVWSRPSRTAEWLASEARDMPAWLVEQEYPETEKQALGTLKSRAFFLEDALEAMYADVRQPLLHNLSDKFRGLVRIYCLPSVGKKYCLFSDPSDGKDDPHCIIVMDAITGEEVAESHGKIPADEVALIHDELVRLYFNAFNGYEINATAGGHFDSKIKALETPNQCYRLKTDGKLDRNLWGWFTSKALKDKAVRKLEEAIRLRQIIPHSRQCLDELSQFIQPEGAEPQKPRGGHDDYIDAFGRVILLRDYAPIRGMKVESFKYA